MVKQFMEAAQEDGEQDRIRIMQAEDEILSLQAELDETLVEMEESSRRARYHAERGEYNQQMVDRLSSELDTVKNAYNLAVDEFSESKTVGGQLLARLNKVDAVVEAKTAENENLLKDFQDRNQEALDEMKKSKEGSEGERKLLLDNVEHLESLRDNLEKSLSEKMEVVYACKKEVSDTQELLDSFKTKNEEIVKMI
jgi:chromosome segregation ATPase